jgi:arylsulfatase A-like enzyme
VIRYPAGRDAGLVVDDQVRLEDVMPTCLEACDIEVPDGLDALSLGGDLPGRVSRGYLGPPLAESVAMVMREAGYTRGVATESVTDGRYHYLRYSDGTQELFDLSVDPGENRNLATKRQGIVRRMIEFLSDP